MEYYINADLGEDQPNRGSINYPFKTFEYAVATISFTEDIDIYLLNGIYNINTITFMNKLSTGMTLKIIGKGQSTILKQNRGLCIGSNSPGGKPSTNVYFCSLIYDFCNKITTNYNFAYTNLWYENVLFINCNTGGYYGAIFPALGSVVTINNCIKYNYSKDFLRCSDGIIRVNHSYGYFTSGYGTADTAWNKSNNLLISGGTALQLSENYVITDPLSNSSIGLYSGNYMWLKVLLSIGEDFFSIHPKFYNSELKSYNKLETLDFVESFVLDDLFLPITIEDETFKPIEKFNNFKLVYKENTNMNLNGIRSNKELIVASDDIITSVSSSIEYFKLISSQTGNGNIKIAMSTDKGHTWNTYSNGILSPLPVTIPIKPYPSLSPDEKSQWDAAKDVIGEQGISVELLNGIDFNLIENLKSLRFAYVLNRPTYRDTAETDTLSWKFDAKGHLKKMKDSEYDTEIYEQQIKFISLIENPLIKVNILV